MIPYSFTIKRSIQGVRDTLDTIIILIDILISGGKPILGGLLLYLLRLFFSKEMKMCLLLLAFWKIIFLLLCIN